MQPGQGYGYRVDGTWEPEVGLRFYKAELLVDPYAEVICGFVDWKQPIFPYPVESGDDLQRDDRDSAAAVPKCVVVVKDFDRNGGG